jgi:hypothetical protein
MSAQLTIDVAQLPYWQQPVTLAQLISETLGARVRCESGESWAGVQRWDSVLDRIESDLPRGSGIDSGTKIVRDVAESETYETIRLTGGWHAMDSSGYYCGWYDFAVTIRAGFSGIMAELSWAGDLPGEDYSGEDDDEWAGVSDPSDYLIDVYSSALGAMVKRVDYDDPPAPRTDPA